MRIKLPNHIKQQAVENLIEALAKTIEFGSFEMDQCELQPTSRAARLAAEAAVCVLLAHEIGQEINSDLEAVLETAKVE